MAEERSAFEAKEDNYRVEVRDDDNKLIEAISKASDFRVSLAAWHAAIRARPGMRLLHLNNDHVMSVIDAPGLPVSPRVAEQHVDLRFGDLREWHYLRAFCARCMRGTRIDADQAKRRFGAETFIGDVERRLSCRGCGRGPAARLEIHRYSR